LSGWKVIRRANRNIKKHLAFKKSLPFILSILLVTWNKAEYIWKKASINRFCDKME
jgi:hypothetical protein